MNRSRIGVILARIGVHGVRLYKGIYIYIYI